MKKKYNASNAGLVALDPRNGQILAMVGSRNYFDDTVDGQVNTALALRQPGSTFKPIVYATAFKKGYTPETIMFDLKTQFSTACEPLNLSNDYPCYSPDNYNGKFKGPISMREALAQSINVIGVKTLYLSGISDSIKTAQDLGITTLSNAKRYGLSLVLGGGEVTLLEMTSAYGAFANDGNMYPTTSILTIKTAKNKIIYSNNTLPKQVLEKEIARTINDILSDNVARAPEFGTNSPLYFSNARVASKTGTTNNFRDVWVIGYTPSVVVGTWAGNNDNSAMDKKIASFILAPIWHQAMTKAIARYSASPFPLAEKMKKNNLLDQPTVDIYEGLTPNDPQFTLWQYPIYVWANELVMSALASSTNATTSITSPDAFTVNP